MEDPSEGVKEVVQGPVKINNSEKLVADLEQALKHVEDNQREAEYWIRSALQQIVAESALEDDSTQ